VDARSYYQGLAGTRLKRCYDLAPPRVRQALEAEIEFVLRFAGSVSTALELGCGYGRVLRPLAARAHGVLGIDTSLRSLRMARDHLRGVKNCRVAAMDASHLALGADTFDIVVCIQNGLSAFHVDRREVVREALRVLRPGGTALFSSYAERFWPDRLEWFRIQADHGLIGEIDETATGAGDIVCRDGFRATTLRPRDFEGLVRGPGRSVVILEVDASSLFCVVRLEHEGR
jgi:SAM-dependent methyltransferase